MLNAIRQLVRRRCGVCAGQAIHELALDLDRAGANKKDKAMALRVAEFLRLFGFEYRGALGGGQPVFGRDHAEYSDVIYIGIMTWPSSGYVMVGPVQFKADRWRSVAASLGGEESMMDGLRFDFESGPKEVLSNISRAVEHCEAFREAFIRSKIGSDMSSLPSFTAAEVVS